MTWGRFKPPVGYGINWGHPLTDRLVRCFLINEGSGNTLTDLAQRKDADKITDPADWSADQEGYHLDFASGDDGYRSASVDISGNFSYFAKVRVDASINYDSYIGMGGSSTYFQRTNDNRIQYRSIGLSDNTMNCTATAVAGNVAWVFYTWDGSTKWGYVYHSGTWYSISESTSGTHTGGGNFEIGANGGGGVPLEGGSVYAAMFWEGRVLSFAEMKEIQTNTYCFIHTPRSARSFASILVPPPPVGGADNTRLLDGLVAGGQLVGGRLVR